MRTRTITIHEEVYENDFPGCTATSHAECACGTWEPPACNACGDSINDGDAFCWYEDIDLPWLAADDADQSTTFVAWHAKCERRCQSCDGTGDVNSPTGEWKGTCDCQAGADLLREAEQKKLVSYASRWADLHADVPSQKLNQSDSTPTLEKIKALHNDDGGRWTGFPRADRFEKYCTGCQEAAPCTHMRIINGGEA